MLEKVCRDTLECIVTEAEGHEAGPCRETAQDTASQRAALGLRYGRAGAQPAPTTRLSVDARHGRA